MIFLDNKYDWGYTSYTEAELCNGSTTDSDSVCLGSNPSSAATKKSLESDVFATASRLFRLSAY